MKSIIPVKRGQRHAVPARRDDWLGRWMDPTLWWLPNKNSAMSMHMPYVDVTEDDKNVIVTAEVPGMDEKEIDLSWSNGMLTIRGEKKSEKEEKNGGRWYRECSYGTFARSVPTGNVDWLKASATCRHGVLTVTLPKIVHAQKSITIPIN